MALNRRQVTFVDEYFNCGSLAEAVMKAGYQTVNPHATGGEVAS